VLNDDKLGESIWQVEELIRKHEDFEKTIEAQEEKFDTLKRITLVRYTCLRPIRLRAGDVISIITVTRILLQLELAFKEQLETEQRARVAEKERVERERLEARKQREVQRITDVSVFTDVVSWQLKNSPVFRRERKKATGGRPITRARRRTAAAAAATTTNSIPI